MEQTLLLFALIHGRGEDAFQRLLTMTLLSMCLHHIRGCPALSEDRVIYHLIIDILDFFVIVDIILSTIITSKVKYLLLMCSLIYLVVATFLSKLGTFLFLLFCSLRVSEFYLTVLIMLLLYRLVLLHLLLVILFGFYCLLFRHIVLNSLLLSLIDYSFK